MIKYRQLNLDDKPGFDRALQLLQPASSDLTFTNLFMWKHNYGLEVYYDSATDFWILFARPPLPKWKPFFLPPIGAWSDSGKLGGALALMEETAQLEKFPLRIRRAPAQLLESLQRLDSAFTAKEERYTFDYLYRSADLINLAGRKYHAKRNHLNQFMRKYHWEFQTITPQIAAECLELEEEWFNISKHRESLTDEEWAMATVFNHFSELKVTGGVIRIDGRIQAIAVGEPLNQNTVVVHIEKANTEFDGIYVAINQLFVKECWSDWEFINREEDMGIEGLQKAKLSYHPCGFVEKYSIMK
ncbi:hypothetical protein EDC14_104716 [Hydrogenispora ethanolica]|uniref:Phosphatidylglycerol lysyltransferase C-terminal domain-containing protein n=1 Tax=Hydrogenispora ethanolica TaxID=1082276 RepID=A0A4R1QV59_HYDET|nr:phosphatidylglycerol lysyltransferase domain-containing protein [Hydrogenispora ethanolica]TCL57113.1 hypothetical protein EDC14_104716 [Hydrogenispora ethanolica]